MDRIAFSGAGVPRVTLEMAAAYDRLAEIAAAEELGYQGGLRVDLF